MSFKKALPFKKAVAFAGAASMLLGVSSLSAYQNDWSDKKLSPDDNNSWFKVDGEIWASYEFKDKRPDNKVDYSGFTVGRAVVNLQGQGTKGDADGWGYRILMDANTTQGSAGSGTLAKSGTPSGSSYFDGNTPPTPYVKYAYFQIPLMKGTTVRAGFQPTPGVGGGSNLEGIWDHRYLDGDGKAMMEELGLSPSSDGGLGIQHKNDMFGLDLLLGNGEGYNQIFGANGQGVHLGLNQVYKGGLTIADVASGNKPSMGLDLFGNLYLTPMKSEKDSGLDLTVSFPFRFQNIVGVERREYEGLSALDFTDVTYPNWTYIKGDARAKKDYNYGVEVDAKLKMSAESSITIGAGTAVKVDRQTTAVAVGRDDFITDLSKLPPSITWQLQTMWLSNRYYEGRDAIGRANYVFVSGKFGHAGFVARYSAGTGNNSNVTSEKMGVATPNGMAKAAEGNLYALMGDDFSSLITADKGLQKFRKITVAATFEMNKRFRVALGLHDILTSQTNGESIKVDPMDQFVSGTSLTSGLQKGYAANNVPTGFPGDINSGLKAGTITSAQLFGVKDHDRQTFLRMVYYY